MYDLWWKQVITQMKVDWNWSISECICFFMTFRVEEVEVAFRQKNAQQNTCISRIRLEYNHQYNYMVKIDDRMSYHWTFKLLNSLMQDS